MEKQSYYGYYTTTPSFSTKEKRALHDLFGRDFFRKDKDNDLSDEQVQRILSRVKPAMKKWLNITDLLPFLKRHHVLTDSELQFLKTSKLRQREQAIRLVEFLINKGSYGIAAFYLSLIESSEQLRGIPAHYQLAGELKQTVHAECGVDAESYHGDQDDRQVVFTSSIALETGQSLQMCLKKLRSIRLPKSTAEELISNLGLSREDIHTLPSSLESICSIWMSKESNPFIDDLVKALILTRTTGRYASLVCSTKEKSESPGVINFFLTLGEQWVMVAEYLGYSREEVGKIVRRFPDSIENQVSEFLELWELPSTGQLSLPLLHQLKGLAGITSEQTQSRKLADRTDVPSYVYMNKRLKTDAAGIPHRSLDSYQHYSTRSPALKASYDSFSSYEPATPPTSTPPKPPRSYSSTGNQPRGSFTSPNSGNGFQQKRENDFQQNQSLSRANIPRDVDNYSNTGTSERGGDDVSTLIRLSLTPGTLRVTRRTPPPPPSRPSPGSYRHDSETQRTQSPVTGTQFLVMFSFGGMTGNKTHDDPVIDYPVIDDPVIEELSDDYPMEIIDDQSADGSPPPLSDGRASPALEMNDLNDHSDHGDHGDVNNLNDLDDHGDQEELNDFSAVTPPSTHPSSPVVTPDHTYSSLPQSASHSVTPVRPLTTPEVGAKGNIDSYAVGSLPEEHSGQLSAATPLTTVGNVPYEHSIAIPSSSHAKPSDVNIEVQSSNYPPSSTTTGERDTHAISEVSSSLVSLPIQPGVSEPHKMTPAKGAPMSRDDEGETGLTKNRGELKGTPEKPKSLEDDNSIMKETPIALPPMESPPPPARPAMEAPDRKYHSRARLDSLEDRNNLDTDSEFGSYSESEKESDMEDYLGVPTLRRRAKRSPQREPSFTLSSSEDDDAFPEERNDLSVVSSPELELPPGGNYDDDGGFGVSLSVGVPPAKRQKRSGDPLNTKNLHVVPPASDTLAAGDKSGHTDTSRFDQSREKMDIPGETFVTLSPELTAGGHFDASVTDSLNDFTESKDKNNEDLASNVQTIEDKNELEQHEGVMSGQPALLLSGRPEYMLSGRPESSLSGQDSSVKPSSEVQSLNYLGDMPPAHHSMMSSYREEVEPRRDPASQVTRTSDQVIESTSYSTSSSDHLQPPVRRSFSSLPAAYNPPSVDEDYLLRPSDLAMSASLSAPSTGLQMFPDHPPPPFTHYAAPPPIFTAHVLEESIDTGLSMSTVEESDVHDNASHIGVYEKELGMEDRHGQWSHSNTGMGMESMTSERHDTSLLSTPVHRSHDDRSTGSHSLLINSLDNPPTAGSSLQSTERDHVTRQQEEPPTGYLSQDVVQALEDPDGAEVLSALLESGANINLPTRDGEYAVHIAVRVEKGLEKMKMLLQNRADRNAARMTDFKTPLHLACLRQDLDMVQLLLDSSDVHPCPQDSQGFTPLHFRQTLENAEITKCLINKGAAVDIPCKDSFLTPLLVCCVVGRSTYDSACLLVQSDANVNGSAQASNKPLIAASAADCEAMVQLLLNKDANINIMDQDRSTPLLKACQNKHVSVAKQLCQRNFVDVNAANKDGVTPLMAAVCTNTLDLVLVLLQNGAYHDVSRVVKCNLPGGQVSEFEITPLADAAIRGFLDVIGTLVDYGATINAINVQALPPITGAILAGQEHVVEYFTKQNDLDISLEGLMQPFIMAVKCSNLVCAEMVIERYPGGIDVMLRSATDGGLHELAECIETFQQSSFDSTPQQPRITLQPDQLPWDTKLHPPANEEKATSALLSGPKSKNDPSPEAGVVQQGQQELQQVTNYQGPRSQVPAESASFNQSSLHSYETVSREGGLSTVSSTVKHKLPLEASGRPLRAGSHDMLPSDDNEEWNQFNDDDSGDESGGVVKVLHVDDPRLSFGQSVYVGRRESQESVQVPAGSRAATGLGQLPFGHSLRNSGGVRTSDSNTVSTLPPPSLSQGLLTPADLSTTAPPLLPPNSFVPPTMGKPPQSTPESIDRPPLVPSHQFTSSEQQPQVPRTLPSSVAQSLPGSMSDPKSSQMLQSGFAFGTSDVATSSLGFAPPLRARATDDDRTSNNSDLTSGTLGDDRLLFAPRPKSPPPLDTPTSAASSSVNLKTPTSLTSNVVEVLHEFAQLTISAAIRQKSHEVLIDRAVASGFEHITMFFLNYFHSPAEFARGSGLVSEFIGGTPSPLNFLLTNNLVSEGDFKQVMSDLGRTDFMEQLMIALHQFQGSDKLPKSGEEMMTGLFNQTFTIGSLYPNSLETAASTSSMTASMGGATNETNINETVGRTSPPVPHAEPERSDSPPPPKPFTGPAAQKQHTFPETGGHRLGHGTTDLAKVNNPRNIVTPLSTPSPKTTPMPTPPSENVPALPRKLSTSSIASTTSSLSSARPQQQHSDSGLRKQKPGLSSMSSSCTVSRESLNSGHQLKSVVASDRVRWGNEVEEPEPSGSGPLLQPKSGEGVQSIQLEQISALHLADDHDELNDIDNPGRDKIQLPLSLSVQPAPADSRSSASITSLEDQPKPSDSSTVEMGVATVLSDEEQELDSGDDYQMNNLDSDDETCPTGAAFDVIDNVSFSTTHKSEPLPPTSVSPTTEEVHHTGFWSDNPLSTDPVSSTSTPGFVQSLEVDALHTKSALPPLKSTYGAAGIGALESPEEPSPDSTMISVPNLDLVKHMKPDFVQHLSNSTNKAPKPGIKGQSVDESVTLRDTHSSEFGMHEPSLGNKNLALEKTSKVDKDQTEIDDEKANIDPSSLVKRQGFSVGFYPKSDSKRLDGDPLHCKALFPVETMKSTKVYELDQSKPRVSGHTFTPPNAELVLEGGQNRQTDDSPKLPSQTVTTQSYMPRGSEPPKSHPVSRQLPATSPTSGTSGQHKVDQPLRMPDRVLKLEELLPKPPFMSVSSSGRLTQDIVEKKIATKSVLSASLNSQTYAVQEESDSTDTETDEESRGSLLPSRPLHAGDGMHRISQRADPMSSVERDEVRRTPSPEGVKVYTGGAWNKKLRRVPANKGQSPQLDSPELPQQPGKFRALRQSTAAAIEHTKRASSAKKSPSRSSSKDSLSPPSHHTSSKAKESTLPTVKKVSQRSKGTITDKKRSDTPKSPLQTKRTFKTAPTTSPSVGRKPRMPKPLPKESVKGTHSSGKKSPLHYRPSKSSKTSFTQEQSPTMKHKIPTDLEKRSEHSETKMAEHKNLLKAKTGFPVTVTKIDKDKLVSTDEEHDNFHVKEKPVHTLSIPALSNQGSDHSSSSMRSVSSLMASGFEHQLRVSLQDIAYHSEQIFGFEVPNVMISGVEEGEMFMTIAKRVGSCKWKILGRYLGLDDDVLEEIKIENHFAEERCLKMLKRFRRDIGEGATYVKLAIALKDTMHDSLVTDISKYFPQYHRTSGSFSTSESEFELQVQLTSNHREMDSYLNQIKENFEVQRNNGKHKALLRICYPQDLSDSRANYPLCFELNITDDGGIRVIEDMCLAAACRKVKKLSINIAYE